MSALNFLAWVVVAADLSESALGRRLQLPCPGHPCPRHAIATLVPVASCLSHGEVYLFSYDFTSALRYLTLGSSSWVAEIVMLEL